MRVLFLDIDGVKNTHEPLDPEVMCGRIHPDKVWRLNQILRDTGAKLVLSSAWRYIVHRGESGVVGLEWLLRSHGIMAGRLIGITRPDTLIERIKKWDGNSPWIHVNERGQQIADYLDGLRYLQIDIESYVVIDDLDLGISASCHPFVHVDGTVGLTNDDVVKAVKMLKANK